MGPGAHRSHVAELLSSTECRSSTPSTTLPRSGYRGSDLVLWHSLTVPTGPTLKSGYRVTFPVAKNLVISTDPGGNSGHIAPALDLGFLRRGFVVTRARAVVAHKG